MERWKPYFFMMVQKMVFQSIPSRTAQIPMTDILASCYN